MGLAGRGLFAWVALVVALAAALAVSFSAYRLADYSWNQVVDYRSPYADLPKPRGAAEATSGPAVAQRVVLIIVDGLREDVSRKMRGLSTLREHGADLILTAPEPSLSYPNWTTILSGAPQDVTGVTTNWYEGRVPIETLLSQAFSARRRVVVVGPTEMDELYGVKAGAAGVSLRDWPESGEYLSGTLVDDALRLVRNTRPSLAVVHLPDIDEAGHDHGGASRRYLATALRVDADLQRLVEGLQDGHTAFVVVSDHGHIDTGGHGGWERDVVSVPAVFAGEGIRLHQGRGRLEDVAPTVAVLAGIPSPRQATGVAMGSVVATTNGSVFEPASMRRLAFAHAFAESLTGFPAPARAEAAASTDEAGAAMTDARDTRLATDRQARLPLGVGLATAGLAVLLAVGLASWRALVASLVGTIVYYAIYDGLYFGLHGHEWSLSAFNSEDLVAAFMNARMAEAAVAGLLGCVVSGLVYAGMRDRPRGPREGYAAGWLMLGPVTVLAIQATLALQVAWFLWAWGPGAGWGLPDLRWGFKYDLDLVQATALGAAAFLGSVATYLVGRYHPRTARS